MSYYLYNFKNKKKSISPDKDLIGSYLLYENGVKYYMLTTPLSDGVSTTATEGSFATTSNSTGKSKLFVCKNESGLKWFELSTGGGSSSIEPSDIPSGIDAIKIANGEVSNTEFQYLNGVTSPIQSQLDQTIKIFDIRSYGAVVDGVTNDKDAVIAAIEDAKTNGGGIIYFPPGITKTIGSINIDAGSTNQGQYIFQGSGSASKWYPTGVGVGFGLGIGNASEVIFRDFAVVGGTSAGASDTSFETNWALIVTTYTTKVIFERMLILGLATTANHSTIGLIYLNATLATFRDCVFGANTAPNSSVVSAESCNGLVFENCFFVDYHTLDGIYYNKVSNVGSTKHWIRVVSPYSQQTASNLPHALIIRNSRFDENTANSLVSITGTSEHSVLIENTSFNGGFGQNPCVRASTLKQIIMRNVYVGYDPNSSVYDSCIFTDVGFVDIDGMVHDAPNGADKIQLLGTTQKLKIRNTSGVNLLNTANSLLDYNNNNLTEISNTNYTALISDDLIIYTSLSGSNKTVTLPTAVGIKGKIFNIKDASGNAASFNIILDPNGAETIDGGSTAVINTNYGRVKIISDGVNWLTIN